MTNSENTKTIYRLFSENKFDEVLKYVADNVEVVSHAFGMTFNGRDQFGDFMKGFKNAFPDIVLNITKVFENGAAVAAEFIAEGTHTGSLVSPAGEIPATRKKVKLNACEILEWKNGKVISIHNYQDSSSLMKQIGIA